MAYFVVVLFRYDTLLDLGKQRAVKLDESLKAYQLVREAGELAQWITDKVGKTSQRKQFNYQLRISASPMTASPIHRKAPIRQ